jgi:hypothetical protein
MSRPAAFDGAPGPDRPEVKVARPALAQERHLADRRAQ